MLTPELERVEGGWVVQRGDGHALHVRPMRLFRLVEVPDAEPRATGRFWCYLTFEAAVLAGAAWDISPDTEPDGFVRSGGARQRFDLLL